MREGLDSVEKTHYANFSFFYRVFLIIHFELETIHSEMWVLLLTLFQPMFDLCRNKVVGFYYQNVWKTPVKEWHFK